MESLIVPGDHLNTNDVSSVISGPGIYYDFKTQSLLPVNAGIKVVSHSKKGECVYINFNSKRYIPSVGDYVIGIITQSFSDSYRVSIANFSSPVSLSYSAFPNASKKNKPSLKIGDLCYARVCKAGRELEAEIECMDSSTGKDSGFGLLDGGMLIQVTLAFARELLFNNEYPLLKIISQYTEFEIAIGLNGRIWIKTNDLKHAMACYRSILDCQSHPVSAFKEIVKTHFRTLTNSI